MSPFFTLSPSFTRTSNPLPSNLEDYLESAPDEEYVPNTGNTAEAAAKEEEKPSGKVVKTEVIYSPVNGTAADISEAPDEAFAGRMMGDGAMVVPQEQTVYAFRRIACIRNIFFIRRALQIIFQIGFDYRNPWAVNNLYPIAFMHYTRRRAPLCCSIWGLIR